MTFPFFKHYKVDLFRECPFWYENGFCMNRACGVEAADEVGLAFLLRWHFSFALACLWRKRPRCLRRAGDFELVTTMRSTSTRADGRAKYLKNGGRRLCPK